MKNILNYSVLESKEPRTNKENLVNAERLIFFLKKKEMKTSPIQSEGIPSELLEKVKQYLSSNHKNLIKDSFGNDEKKRALKEVISSFVSGKKILNEFSYILEQFSLEDIAETISESIAGIGILKNIINPSTTDIMINDWNNIWVDDYIHGSYKSKVHFNNEEEYIALTQKFTFASGKKWGFAKPFVNAHFPNMRVHMMGFDIANGKVNTSIRLISKELRLTDKLIEETNYASPEMMNFFKAMIKSKTSFIVSGETGTGKTELIRKFFEFIQEKYRSIMLEDSPETFLPELYPYLNILNWLTRDSDEEGNKAIGYSELIVEALRQNPDWLMVQETRSKEAFHMIKAAETGHGLGSSLHTMSAIGIIQRLITLCQEYSEQSDSYYGKRITNVIQIGIHLERINNVRRITQIVEFVDYKNGEPIVNYLYKYNSKTNTHEALQPMSKKLLDHFTSTNDIDIEGFSEIVPK